MAKPLRPKRGTTAKNDAFVGLASEITVDTEKHSIRVHDGVTAGGHEILPDCLPTAGGTMTGAVQWSGYSLSGDESGKLLWDSKYVLNNSFLMPVNTGAVMLTAGTSSAGGAYFRLYGKDNASGAGQFVLATTDGENTKALTGKPDGTLTWDGKDVDVVDSSGDDWIRYANGIQIVWGSYTRTGGSKGGQVKTLPVAFKNAYYRLVVTDTNSSSSFISPYQDLLTYAKTTTSFKVASTTNADSDDNYDFIAIGRWK